ncbi:uncharacterized protein SPSK_03564 [Sporothrix schenckii 1099-18]|uniref:Uncharacterized protein n=2 Tax=Sporothrix schenckii TaxID=29908 RepID=U7PXL7_SPOS1|nr:uncharacterized protein SPSK_03564 [Sporothrix schenckii 1099-18]ERS99464.1 hypothetical protein HMPREF1624_04664 [Sporothrix schenckii ATCC 58251]KJR82804.1 hypothetical protein SPSK_03564 [Sporothrix schenckii 1099-18]
MAARLVARLWLALLVGAVFVAANTEKAIFVAGDGQSRRPGGGDADRIALSGIASSLPRLTPDRNAWRTSLPAAFPWADNFPTNGTTWLLLDELTGGQRYELRVCWAASQPTDFSVDVFDLATVAATPALSASLASFVERGPGTTATPSTPSTTMTTATASLLRIVAAADFVAADRAAMHPDRVPPVLTDIILDPYLFNAVPHSLLPVVAAIVVVAGASAWLARRVILPQLRAVADGGVGAAGVRPTKGRKAQKAQNKDR